MNSQLNVTSSELKDIATKIKDTLDNIYNKLNGEDMISHFDKVEAEKGTATASSIWHGPAAKEFKKVIKTHYKKCIGKFESESNESNVSKKSTLGQLYQSVETLNTIASNYATSEQQNEEVTSELSNDLDEIF